MILYRFSMEAVTHCNCVLWASQQLVDLPTTYNVLVHEWIIGEVCDSRSHHVAELSERLALRHIKYTDILTNNWLVKYSQRSEVLTLNHYHHHVYQHLYYIEIETC